jgi:putative FmdB family regulatory protein
MPIFEYVCRECGAHFERLVQGGATPSCPACSGVELEKQLSVFAVGTRGSASTPMPGPCGTCGDPRGPGACSMD